MKRSEMVNKLQQHFDNSDLFDPATIGEDILKFVEELGMQPPNVTLKELIHSDLHTIGTTHFYACWESENE